MQYTRAELLNQLTSSLFERNTERPLLVAIDGRSAAGKTTLADELALHIEKQGRAVLRSSIDDFHPPGHKYRSRDRPHTPESYYAEGFDYALFREYVLDPLRQGAARCRLAYWDSFNDVAYPERWTEIPDRAIALIDGAFLLRPDLRHYWDYTIWLHIDWETMVERAVNRDVAWVGSAEIVAQRYRTFWIPLHTLYETQDHPAQQADIVLDNQYPETPALIDSSILKIEQLSSTRRGAHNQ